MFNKKRITTFLDRPYIVPKWAFGFLFFLPLFLLNPLSTTAQSGGFDNSFCTDTITNGQLHFQDGYTIEKVNHISTADTGMLVFAAIKNSVHQRSRVVKLNKQNLIEWTTDFYDAQPGSRLSIQQATSIDNKTIFAGVLQQQDQQEPPSLFLILKYGNTPYGRKKRLQLSSFFTENGVDFLLVNSIAFDAAGQILLGFSLANQNRSYSGVAVLSAEGNLLWSRLLGHPSTDKVYATIGAEFYNGNILLCSSWFTGTPDDALRQNNNLIYTTLGAMGSVLQSNVLSITRNGSGGMSTNGYFKIKNNLIFTQTLLSGDYFTPGAEPVFYTTILDTDFNIIRSEQLRSTTDYIGANTQFTVDNQGYQMRITAQPFVDSSIFAAVFQNGNSVWQRAYSVPFKQKEGSFSVSDYPGKPAVYRMVYAQKGTAALFVNRLQFNPLNEGTCHSESDTATINALPMQVGKQTYTWQIVSEQVLLEAPDQMTTSTPEVTYIPACFQQINCSSVDLEGPIQVCRTDSVYTLTARRSAYCNNPVKWVLDSALFSAIQTANDTTLNVKFLPGQRIKIKAVLEGCSVVADSIEVHTLPVPAPFTAGGVRYLCPGGLLQVPLPDGYTGYQWNEVPAQTLKVTEPGRYIADAYDYCGRKYTDTLIVLSDSLQYTPQLSRLDKCAEDTLKVVLPDGYADYNWSSGSHLRAHKNNALVWPVQPVAYSVTLISPVGCTYTDTFSIRIKTAPSLTLPNDTALCTGQVLELQPSKSFAAYQWNTGATTKNITISTPGHYILRAVNPGECAAVDTFRLLPFYPAPEKFIPRDTVKCSDSLLRITVYDTTFSAYLWNTGSHQSFIEVAQAGTYTLEVTTRDGCKAVEQVRVSEAVCRPLLLFPTAFTPNRDGLNDTFKPKSFDRLDKFSLRLYNRWGQLIFESTDPQKGWDGNWHQKPQPTGVYVWQCSYQFKGGPHQFLKGTFSLIR